MKNILILIVSCLLALSSFGQDTIPEQAPVKQKKPIGERLFYGGTIGASFGNYSRIAVYPHIGMRWTNRFRTGLQIGYEYITDKRYSTTYTYSNYGVSIFSQYNIFPALYLHLEPAVYSYDRPYYENSDRVWVPFVFVGAGYHQRLGARSVLYFQVKFDLVQDANSPYKDWAPFFDIGMGFGI